MAGQPLTALLNLERPFPSTDNGPRVPHTSPDFSTALPERVCMRKLSLSVILPNYNHGQYLAAALEGLLSQSRPPDEVLVLDDASTDNSGEILDAYAARFPQLRVYRNEQNAGVIAAHQRLFDLARGDWVYAGAADDERLPGFFEHAMRMAEHYPAAGVVITRMLVMDDQGRPLGEVAARNWSTEQYVSTERFLAEYLEAELPFHSATAATIFRRDALAEVGWFRPELGSFSDSFAVRAIALRHGACYSPHPGAAWRKLPGSVSQTVAKNARRSLEVIELARERMMSAEFRDTFPTSYTQRWYRRARRNLLWNYWLGETTREESGFRSRCRRSWSRIKRVPEILRLAAYHPTLPR